MSKSMRCRFRAALQCAAVTLVTSTTAVGQTNERPIAAAADVYGSRLGLTLPGDVAPTKGSEALAVRAASARCRGSLGCHGTEPDLRPRPRVLKYALVGFGIGTLAGVVQYPGCRPRVGCALWFGWQGAMAGTFIALPKRAVEVSP